MVQFRSDARAGGSGVLDEHVVGGRSISCVELGHVGDVTLKNQPLPSGSVLASDGSARSASLTSTTSPLTGM